VTSDVQFRKGASIPPLLVGHGYPDLKVLKPCFWAQASEQSALK